MLFKEAAAVGADSQVEAKLTARAPVEEKGGVVDFVLQFECKGECIPGGDAFALAALL